MNYLYEYSTFETVEALNEAIDGHIQRNQYELNKTDRDIFIMLGRYSVKYPGASHLKTETIANAIGKSKRTIQRSLRKLERLGMIERKEFIRKKSGGNGANIYVILPVDVAAEMTGREDDGKPTDINDNDTDDNSETINLSSYKNKTLLETAKPKKPTEDEMIKRSLRNAIPKPIYDALSPFFNGKDLYNTYGILLRAKAKISRFITLEEHHERYIDAFYNVIRLYKAGKIRNLSGYLYVTWQRLTAEISRQIKAELLAEL